MCVACRSGGAAAGAKAAAQEAPLASYAPQRLVLAPTARVVYNAGDSLILAAGSSAAAAKAFDDELLRRLQERGLATNWFLPADLLRSYERNRSYAANPYQLAVDPLRSAQFVAASRYGEPLSTQLRTMIALHDEARLVLLPVQLALHQRGRTILRLALLDPRFAEARWVGEIASDSSGAQSRASISQVAQRVADLFSTP